jgi:hypothetical protein
MIYHMSFWAFRVKNAWLDKDLLDHQAYLYERFNIYSFKVIFVKKKGNTAPYMDAFITSSVRERFDMQMVSEYCTKWNWPTRSLLFRKG